MSFVIEHDLEVKASADAVWQVITDFDSYKQWNPFLLDCESSMQPGEPIDLTVQLGKQVRQEQEIIDTVTPGKGFTYRMKPMPGGALSSHRIHEITVIDENTCRYRSRFELQGWLSPVVKLAVGKHLLSGFGGMSHGIKDRAEALNS